MSGREFKFGDRVEMVKDGERLWGIVMKTPVAGRIGLVDVRWNGWQGDSLELANALDPSAQPHVAAGRGWVNQMREKVASLCLGLANRDESHVDCKYAEIQALLDDIVELPGVEEMRQALVLVAPILRQLQDGQADEISLNELMRVRAAVSAAISPPAASDQRTET